MERPRAPLVPSPHHPQSHLTILGPRVPVILGGEKALCLQQSRRCMQGALLVEAHGSK